MLVLAADLINCLIRHTCSLSAAVCFTTVVGYKGTRGSVWARSVWTGDATTTSLSALNVSKLTIKGIKCCSSHGSWIDLMSSGLPVNYRKQEGRCSFSKTFGLRTANK